MSLIFDNFPSLLNAAAFRDAVWARFGLDGDVYLSQNDSDSADFFRFVLGPPIVLIERVDDFAAEHCVEDAVDAFGGRFAGT